ncbi:MAG: hydroxymethylbilane synthase [Thermoleophilia bacterium]
MGDALTAAGHRVRLVELVTTGDRWSATGSEAAPDRGMFVKELEQALLAGEADIAVHSAKDMPTQLPDGLDVLAVPPREDPRDVLVAAGALESLAQGATVGTGSPRRSAQLLTARPDLRVVPIRGNVDTRLRRRDEGDVHAVVLAMAGLSRLGRHRVDLTPLHPDVCTPAAGQGLLALEGRAGDEAVSLAVAALDDLTSRTCLQVERAVLAGLGGGCLSPVGVLCTPDADGLRVTAFAAADADGTDARRVTVHDAIAGPEALAGRVVQALMGAR